MAERINRHRPELTPRQPITIPVALVDGMLAGIRARSEPDAQLLLDAGIAAQLLLQPSGRVTAAQYSMLFRLLIERREDEGLGFLSRRLKPGSFATVARGAVGARDLETAIRRAARTFSLLQDDVVLELRLEGDRAGLALCFGARSGPTFVFPHEMLLRVFWRLFAWLAGGRLPATRFDFAFAAPPHAGSYDTIFPAPRAFDRDQSAVWFERARMGGAVRRDEAALRVFLADAQAHSILPPRPGKDAARSRVRSHLLGTQPSWPDLATTADALCISTATLQRRLAREGTTFQALKDELRRDLAIVRLNTSKASLGELAHDLGFSDRAGFQRAFKAWTGSAPGAYRERANRGASEGPVTPAI